MRVGAANNTTLAGGVQFRNQVVRPWRWSAAGEPLSAPVRCKREHWYLVRGYLAPGRTDEIAEANVNFLRNGAMVTRRCITLEAIPDGKPADNLLGWVQTPPEATHLQVRLSLGGDAAPFSRLVLHPVSERDPKCHPLAAVPRWSVHRPPFPLERVVLPGSLRGLAELLPQQEIEILERPRSLKNLAARVIGAACVIAPEWINDLNPSLSDLERICAASWMILDLDTFARLLRRTGRLAPKIAVYEAEHELMSARVDYADVPTRGFALEDVVPYATLVDETSFRTRVLRADRSWRRYAAQSDFAHLLTSETPWVNRSGDVLSAARSIECGMLLTTDLPWLVAGGSERLAAPRLAEHLLRMHLGGPVDDGVQYWTRWNEIPVVVRDLGEIPRRYPPLQAQRWAPTPDGVEHLGLTLPASRGAGAERRLMLRTGRIDLDEPHDGLPPEPFEIFMKWLARERRERTAWAEKYLADTTVTWQFDTREGRKYACLYHAASDRNGPRPENALNLRAERGRKRVEARPVGPAGGGWSLPVTAGIFDDRSLEYQAELTRWLRGWIQSGGT